MNFKCIKKYWIEDCLIMSPGDIIVLIENDLYNLTTGVTYKNIPDLNPIKMCIKGITDKSSTTSSITDSERFESITKIMSAIFKKKNHDYGNSFEESLNEEGLAASRIRMGDKWRRYKTLSKGEKAQVDNESIRDTLIDMANYAIMTVMWLDKQK